MARKLFPFLIPFLMSGVARAAGDDLIHFEPARLVGHRQLQQAAEPVPPGTRPEDAREEAADRMEGPSTPPREEPTPVPAGDEEPQTRPEVRRTSDEAPPYPMPEEGVIVPQPPAPGAPEEDPSAGPIIDPGDGEGGIIQPGDPDDAPPKESLLWKVLKEGGKNALWGGAIGGLAGLAFGVPWIGLGIGALVGIALFLKGLFSGGS